MQSHPRSKTRLTARAQLLLPLNARRITTLDTKRRALVVAVLARLLLEAACAGPTTERDDDAA